jgi:hypothetical protein
MFLQGQCKVEDVVEFATEAELFAPGWQDLNVFSSSGSRVHRLSYWHVLLFLPAQMLVTQWSIDHMDANNT